MTVNKTLDYGKSRSESDLSLTLPAILIGVVSLYVELFVLQAVCQLNLANSSIGQSMLVDLNYALAHAVDPRFYAFVTSGTLFSLAAAARRRSTTTPIFAFVLNFMALIVHIVSTSSFEPIAW